MVYWCEVADQRYISEMYTIARQYNVRSSPGSASYVATSLNAGTAWTWEEMVQDLWNEVDPNPIALPFVPDGTPEGFIFQEWKAWDALTHVLQRLACAVRYNPALGTYTIVRLGEEDANATKILRQIRDRLIWDEYPIEPARTRLPEKVRVVFNIQPPPTNATTDYYTIEVADTAPEIGVLAGTRVAIFDDLSALGSTPSNLAALSYRAAERAEDWYRVARNYTRRHNQIYAGVVSEIIQCVFTEYSAFAIEDRGAGYKTSLYAGPADGEGTDALNDWKSTYDTARFACCSDSTGGVTPDNNDEGGGGEGGGTQETTCCENPIASQLYLTITGLACITDVVLLDFIPAIGSINGFTMAFAGWYGQISCDGTLYKFFLYCPGGGGVWVFQQYENSDGGPSVITIESVSCDPFELSSSDVIIASGTASFVIED
jgi:hypothetical protein